MQFWNTFSGRIEISLFERSKCFKYFKFLKTEPFSIRLVFSVKVSIRLKEKLRNCNLFGSFLIFSKFFLIFHRNELNLLKVFLLRSTFSKFGKKSKITVFSMLLPLRLISKMFSQNSSSTTSGIIWTLFF